MTQYTIDPFLLRFEPPIQDGPARSVGTRPLAGYSAIIKDNFDVAGVVTGCGSPEWAMSHPAAESHAAAVSKLLAAGVAIYGKGQMDELAYSLMGANAHYGIPGNPAAPGRLPGGSSSGSAAAVAASLVDIGLGSDTGGSVRVPGTFCGIYGMRTTHDIVDTQGLVPLAPSFDTVGFFARDLQGMQAVAAALELPESNGDPDEHVSYWLPGDLWGLLDPQLAQLLQMRWSEMVGVSGPTSTAPLVNGDISQWRIDFQTIQGYEIWQTFGKWIQENNPEFGPGVKERFEVASRIEKKAFSLATARRNQISDRLRSRLGQRTILVLPTVPGPAPFIGSSLTALDQYRNDALELLCVAGLCGLPQLTIPTCDTTGAPIGISLVGNRAMDRRLLELAGTFKSAKKDGRNSIGL